MHSDIHMLNIHRCNTYSYYKCSHVDIYFKQAAINAILFNYVTTSVNTFILPAVIYIPVSAKTD